MASSSSAMPAAPSTTPPALSSTSSSSSTMSSSIPSPTPSPKRIPPTINISKSQSPSNPILPTLNTPKTSTATLPSERPRSPLPGHLSAIKQEEQDLKTPITPPLAYTDFLKAVSPAVSTPSTGRSPTFDKMLLSGKSTPISQPSSAGSHCPCNIHPHKSHEQNPKASSAPMIPPSPFMRPPHSARTPTSLRRLRIPQSPMWSPATDSPKSSALSRCSPYSPADWVGGRCYESPRSTVGGKPVSVRQVVTKTVTYTRTPLEPAPKGKKRRLE